ncbi:MAG: energy transducer TonB [Pyrinomonadaceae bacterium]
MHHAYAGETVYEFEWHAKSNETMPDWCSIKARFSKSTFTDRINALKAQSWAYVESKDSVAGTEAVVLRSAGAVVRTRWLIWNKDRWFELGVTRRKEMVIDEGKFIGGLKLSSSTGLAIGSGATSTLGDPDADLNNDSKGTDREGLVIVAKPRPGYTDAARQANVQGIVILRVTFLRNGGVGSVSVVKALPYGLTEQAISAAKRMSFLPGISDGKLISTTKQVEYSFSIY